jgi:hypothetical protein
VLTFLALVVVAQSPAAPAPSSPSTALALEALEHALVPTQPLGKLVGSTDDGALKEKNWSPEELRELHLANERTSTVTLVTGGVVGVLAGGGLVAADLLPKPASIWAGALTSSIMFGSILLLAALAAPAQTFEVWGVATRRTARLRKMALTASEWDPVVVDATNRVLTAGVSQTSSSWLEGETPLSDEAFAARIAPNPRWVGLEQEARAGAAGALVLLLTGLVVFAAPPTVVGALDLPPLATVGVVAGGVVAGLLIILGAQAIATVAEQKQSLLLDEYNTAIFTRARAALPPPAAAPPAEPIESVPAPVETPARDAPTPAAP